MTGAYYIKETEAHGYTNLSFLPNAASLAPAGLLESRNNVGEWKAIIRQVEDQWSAGEVEPVVAKAQAAGLTEFPDRVLKTLYTTTPMRLVCCCTREESDDNEVEVVEEGPAGANRGDTLQRLRDTIGLI